MCGVDRIGVREQTQAVAGGKLGEEIVGKNGLRIEHAVPRDAKLLERNGYAQLPGDVFIPALRRDPSFLPVEETPIRLNGCPNLLRGGHLRRVETLRRRNSQGERFKGTLQIQPHYNSANIEDDRFRWLGDQVAARPGQVYLSLRTRFSTNPLRT